MESDALRICLHPCPTCLAFVSTHFPPILLAVLSTIHLRSQRQLPAFSDADHILAKLGLTAGHVSRVAEKGWRWHFLPVPQLFALMRPHLQRVIPHQTKNSVDIYQYHLCSDHTLLKTFLPNVFFDSLLFQAIVSGLGFAQRSYQNYLI